MNCRIEDGGANLAPPSLHFLFSFSIHHSAFRILSSLHDAHVQHAPAPVQRLLVGGEVDVELVALDGAAAVDDLDSPAVVVAGDLEHRAELEEAGVGGDEAPAVVADGS